MLASGTVELCFMSVPCFLQAHWVSGLKLIPQM